MTTYRCVFLGTPIFAIPSAMALLELPEIDLVSVVTQPDKPAGRRHEETSPPVAAWARERHLPVAQPGTKTELTNLLQKLQPDIVVVVAYGRIIPDAALMIPRFGVVNVHPSLLPRWRGPSPIPTAIAEGDTETGVTIMLLDAKIDHGPILAQERVSISPTTHRVALEEGLARLGATMLLCILPAYLAGTYAPVPQDHTHATMSPLLSREHGRLDWTQSAASLERKVRAYEGWPGTWCILPYGRRLKVLRASVGGVTALPAGKIVSHENELAVACGDGHALVLHDVHMEGSKPTTGGAFLRGHRIDQLS